MPSDESDARILEVLGGPVTAFESAMAATLEQVRLSLEAQKGSGNGQPSEAGVDLGAFAIGRIDPERFAALWSAPRALDHTTVSRIENVFATLSGLIERKQGLLRVDVPPGGSLRDTVAQALGDIGRAFGAARTFDLLRAGNFEPQEHGALTQAFRFERWSRAERRRAPPLIVHVDGADLYPGGLADFLDGAVKLVLVVRGAATQTGRQLVPALNQYVAALGEEPDIKLVQRKDKLGAGKLEFTLYLHMVAPPAAPEAEGEKEQP